MARKKDEEKRKRILDAATKVFAAQGFYNATIQDIANEAEVAHGTVYFYFESKDALLIAIFQELLGELIEYIRSEIAKESHAEAKFRRMISLQMSIIEENPDLTKLVLIELPRTGNFLSDGSIDVLDKYIKMIAEVIREGTEQKSFKLYSSADDLAPFIYSGIQGLATVWILCGMRYSLKASAQGIADTLLEGLKAR